MNLRKWTWLFCASLVAASATAPCAAYDIGDAVSLDLQGAAGGRGVSLTVSGNLTQDHGGFAGRIAWQTDAGQTVHTFCTEVTAYARSGEFIVDDVADLPFEDDGSGNPVDPPMGAFKAALIAELHANHYEDAIKFDGGQSGFDDRDQAAAFQIAIWEIVYEDFDAGDFDTDGADRSLNLAMGAGPNQTFHLAGLGDDEVVLAQSWLDELVGGYEGVWADRLIGLRDGDGQDQLLVVPLPPAAALGGIGLLGLILGRRRIVRAATGG